jgi:hypothetical protein
LFRRFDGQDFLWVGISPGNVASLPASEIGQGSVKFIELVLEFIHLSLLGSELIFGASSGVDWHRCS